MPLCANNRPYANNTAAPNRQTFHQQHTPRLPVTIFYMNTTRPTLLILAAGMGSRYGGLKQLDKMGPQGETLLDFNVMDAIAAGFGKVVFVIRESFAEQFKEQVGSRFKDKIAVAYAFQDLSDLPAGFDVPQGRERPWGTAHAVRAARHAIDAPFVVINGDDFYGRDAFTRIAAHLAALQGEADKLHLSMVGYPILNTLSENGSVNRGVCRTEGGALLAIEEVTGIHRTPNGSLSGINSAGKVIDVPSDCLVSMNFWGFTPELFAALENYFCDFLTMHGTDLKAECYLPSLVDSLIRKGGLPCPVLETSASWFGVTYPEDKPLVMARLAALAATGNRD